MASINQHKNAFNSDSFKFIELKFGAVVADSHIINILWDLSQLLRAHSITWAQHKVFYEA